MFRNPWSKKHSDAHSTPAAAGPEQRRDSASISPADLVHRAFWVVLWREPSPKDLQECVAQLEDEGALDRLFHRLLASLEFWTITTHVLAGKDIDRKPLKVEAGLSRIGDNASFIELAYRALLGREADAGGRQFYQRRIEEGVSRTEVLISILQSDEFAERYKAMCPGFLPRDVQLCELANPAKWENPDWRALLRSLVLVPTETLAMHRKGYEFGQLLFGLTRLGLVRDDVRVLSVGAGHEPVLYWLANHVGRVIATDTYGGIWRSEGAHEGDDKVLDDPRHFAPFLYREDRLAFMKMDGRHLAFRAETFDVVYSLSAVEHFGGVAGAREAVADMARVLKPGGVLALATEYVIAGTPHHEAFQPAQVHALLDHPALSLIEPIDEQVWNRFEYKAVDLRVNPYQTPRMVVTDQGSVFTSVMAFLRKRR